MTKKKLIEQIDFLEKELSKLEEKIKYEREIYNTTIENDNSLIHALRLKYNNIIQKVYFRKIIRNKNATIVWFPDNKKIVVKKAKDDSDSVYTAVAYAVVKNIFGSNNTFKKIVDRRLKNEK